MRGHGPAAGSADGRADWVLFVNQGNEAQGRSVRQRHMAGAGALAMNGQNAAAIGLCGNVADLQTTDFGNPQARVVEQVQGAVLGEESLTQLVRDRRALPGGPYVV